MTSPYKNPWLRKPYANAAVEATREKSAARRRALMSQIALWGAVPAMAMMAAAAFALR